jgi:hypothetical protein
MNRMCFFSLAVACFSLMSQAYAFDVASDLFVAGDLHEAWQAAAPGDPPKMFEEVPPTATKADRRLSRGGKKKGGVTGFVYANAADAGAAYDKLLEGMGKDTQAIEGLGDQARSFSAITEYPPAAKMPPFHRAGVLFIRGKTVVYIGLSDMKAEELIPYAKKIDARIQK